MSETEMKVTPERALALANQIRGVTERIQFAAKGRPVRLFLCISALFFFFVLSTFTALQSPNCA